MATDHWHECCGGHEDGPDSRLEGLQRFARSGPAKCGVCEDWSSYVFEFDLGLNAAGSRCEAVAVYGPDRVESWETAGGDAVEFFPFLVILRTAGSSEVSCWLPYWYRVHTKDGIRTKYGQWAPMMQSDLFEDLIRKARAAGYLTNLSGR